MLKRFQEYKIIARGRKTMENADLIIADGKGCI